MIKLTPAAAAAKTGSVPGPSPHPSAHLSPDPSPDAHLASGAAGVPNEHQNTARERLSGRHRDPALLTPAPGVAAAATAEALTSAGLPAAESVSESAASASSPLGATRPVP